GRAEEDPHPRAVSERDRVGRRHLRSGGGGAHIFSRSGFRARCTASGDAGGGHHQSERAQPCTSERAVAAAAAPDPRSHAFDGGAAGRSLRAKVTNGVTSSSMISSI